MRIQTPQFFVMHHGEPMMLDLIAHWHRQRLPFETLHLGHLEAYRFYATQDSKGQQTCHMQFQDTNPICLDFLSGFMCTNPIHLQQQFQQHTTQDAHYLAQAWYALFAWISKIASMHIGGLQHDGIAMRQGHWLYLQRYCREVGLHTPMVHPNTAIQSISNPQPWIGRDTFNQHYDFRPKQRPKTPLVMSAPPQQSQMIWLHVLGQCCWASTPNKKPYTLPHAIQKKCLAVMEKMAIQSGQFLLCNAGQTWQCYDFNPQPNWTLCHLSHADIAEAIAIFFGAPWHKQTPSIKSAPQSFSAPWTTSQGPFIPKTLRPTLSAAHYQPTT